MHSQPDWPPLPGALRPSPFPHPVLHALHGLARALLFPAYWALDQLLGCWAPRVRPTCLKGLRLALWAGAAFLLLVLLGLPLALPGLLLWLPLQAWRRPFCYQPPPPGWEPPAPWRPPAEPARCFGFLSANLCLLPDGLARFSNLQHTQRRADVAGALLLAGLRSSPSRYGATGCSPPKPGAPCGVLTAALPEGLDFVCLQEVFDLRAARPLVSRLAPNLGPVLHDVGAFGLQPGPHLKVLGSGLLLASRYPLLRAAFRAFPQARREDALASKGLLSAQAQVGILSGRRIVGFLHCTHLHAPSGDGHLRCQQLTQLLNWAEQFEAESRPSDETVAFSVLLGDLNFDNCCRSEGRPRRGGAGRGRGPAHRARAFLRRNDVAHIQAPPLRGLLPGDAAEGPGAGGRPPPLPGRPSSRGPPGEALAGPAPGLHHLPGSARRPAEPRSRTGDIQHRPGRAH
ncbi:sphingomyelin phosphodiesterase 5-like isoform X4 [Myotis yumanensis]|uniref:sphingomyelin phosphodiesterase 5-like isoform X4 n=1 Tax=Myotis yumanensis TaxID=159337 RepID=UPI0038D39691